MMAVLSGKTGHAVPRARKTAARDVNDYVGLELRAHMVRRRLVLEDIAAALGVSRRTVMDSFSGYRVWRVDEVEAAARWLGVEVSELLPGGQSREPDEGAQ